jgi:Xaa-Pro aminopeptidase
MSIDEIMQILDERGLDAYVVSHGNRFIGQDILDSEHKLKHLCGFSGSAGALIIGRKGCFLLVDGRYELQAVQEVNDRRINIVHRIPNISNICSVLEENSMVHIGYDAWCWSAADMSMAQNRFGDLQFTDIGDLVNIDALKPVKVLHRDIKYAGQNVDEKLQVVRDFLARQKADYFLLTAADSVSWLLNIYAHDLPYSPVVRAYALISSQNEVTLFADNLQTDLPCQPMSKLADFLQNNKGKIVYDARTTPAKLVTENMLQAADICQQLKAVKNKKEIAGMKACHVRDGVAVTKFLIWLEQNWQGKTELDVVQKLHELRTEQEDFFSESFATIAASGANGAIVHYQPTEKSNKALQQGELLLLDSGGQYLDGTTDITRTVVIGRPNREQITDFTLVLKAHIALARATFPHGTRGAQLDGITRAILWRYGTDYKHGTGHGVACFGNVHEEPVSISAAANYAFEENVVVSDEPGIYKEGKYGIRIESLLRTVKSDKKGFLEFAPLTKVPLDKRLIDEYMLTADELKWLNQYHQDVYDCLVPYMNKEEKKWLKKACSPL